VTPASVFVALLLAAIATPTLAGRPLTTDDAATAGAGSCQVESWLERSRGDRSLVVAPACGLNDAVELDLSVSRSHVENLRYETGVGLAVKWVDPAWKLGDTALGAKVWVGQRRRPGQGPHMDENGLALLASRPLGESLTAHVNLGAVRHPDDSKGHGLGYAALAWTPQAAWLAFAEINAVSKLPSQTATGLRYWLRQDVLGLDLTAMRSAARPNQPGATTLSLGLGWYNIKY
jgi:hypothetical protein